MTCSPGLTVGSISVNSERAGVAQLHTVAGGGRHETVRLFDQIFDAARQVESGPARPRQVPAVRSAPPVHRSKISLLANRSSAVRQELRANG